MKRKRRIITNLTKATKPAADNVRSGSSREQIAATVQALSDLAREYQIPIIMSTQARRSRDDEPCPALGDGGHNWLDITALGDNTRRRTCAACGEYDPPISSHPSDVAQVSDLVLRLAHDEETVSNTSCPHPTGHEYNDFPSGLRQCCGDTQQVSTPSSGRVAPDSLRRLRPGASRFTSITLGKAWDLSCICEVQFNYQYIIAHGQRLDVVEDEQATSSTITTRDHITEFRRLHGQPPASVARPGCLNNAHTYGTLNTRVCMYCGYEASATPSAGSSHCQEYGHDYVEDNPYCIRCGNLGSITG